MSNKIGAMNPVVTNLTSTAAKLLFVKVTECEFLHTSTMKDNIENSGVGNVAI